MNEILQKESDQAYNGDRSVKTHNSILRHRFCITQLAVVCVNIKCLKGKLLSATFSAFLKDNLNLLDKVCTIIKTEFSESVSKIPLLGNNLREVLSRINADNSSIKKKPGANSILLIKLFIYYCETMLSYMHAIEHHDFSKELYIILGDLTGFCTELREEIKRERNVQSRY